MCPTHMLEEDYSEFFNRHRSYIEWMAARGMTCGRLAAGPLNFSTDCPKSDI